MSALPRCADGSLGVYCALCDGIRPFEVDFQDSAHGPLVEVVHISLYCQGCRTLIAQHMTMHRKPWAKGAPARHRTKERA